MAASLVAGLCFAGHVLAADVAVAKEHQLKAAFIYNFTKFVEWPPKNFPDPNSPIVIGVVGKCPVYDEITRVVKDRKLNGREFAVRIIDTPEAARSVNLLFFCASEDGRLAEFLSAPLGANILTVGESEQFARQGGVINFLMEGYKIRFDIDMLGAERAGLKVSAQLQKLARTVRTNK